MPKTHNLPKFLTVKQTADMLQISIQQVYKLVERRQLPVLRLSHRTIRIDRELLENMIRR